MRQKRDKKQKNAKYFSSHYFIFSHSNEEIKRKKMSYFNEW